MTKGQKTWFVILIILVVGLAGVLAYPYAKKYYNEKIKSQNNSSTSPTATVSSSISATVTATPIIDPGVTWLTEPEKLDDLGLFKTNKDIGDEGYYIDTKTYYKIANLDAGGSLILAFLERGMMGNDYYIFRKDKDGKYTYIVNNSTDKENEAIVQKYMQTTQKINGKDSNIIFDTSTRFQSLSIPDFIQTTSGVALKTSGSYALFKDLSSPQKLADTAYGSVYKTYSKSGDTINGRILSIKLVDSQIKYYSIKYDFITDDEVALITWSDGTKNTSKYTPEAYSGCGHSASEHIIINTDNLSSRLIDAGKTTSGDKIYTVGKDDEIMKAAHDNYKIGRTKDILSLEEFAAKKPVFIWKDGFNDYIIFTGRDFAGLVECGKPVIYLYPEKTTNVSVKVGADITKSDPEYNNGWEAIAQPSGKLTVASKIYDYLFWEGQGQEYPIINSGKVVETNNIEQVLKNDLVQLGLNQKESADFMEFWLPKMPSTPFVRLTWLGTDQMNKLAPLSVEPKPDTMIRIFLDFEGFNQPINITPQKLSATARIGFTLVEWGGLLKGEK
ncbi:MAG: hypothetical protein M1338_04565 [Patescibacteria group bacterium]|nr:hypothetical protein [Patescibacteria group bacterium]